MHNDEGELQTVKEALWLGQHRVVALFKAMPVATVVIASDGTIESTTQSFCDLSGYAAEHLRGMRLDDLIVTSGSLEELLSQIRSCIDQNLVCNGKLRQTNGIASVEISAGLMKAEDSDKLLLCITDTATARRSLK